MAHRDQIMSVRFDQRGCVLSPVKAEKLLLVHAQERVHRITRNMDDDRFGEHKIYQA